MKDLQKKFMEENAGDECFFTAVYRTDAATDCGSLKSEIAGALMAVKVLVPKNETIDCQHLEPRSK